MRGPGVRDDANLQALPLPDFAFLPGCGQPFLEHSCIVEVKYQVALPAFFKELAETFGLQLHAISSIDSTMPSAARSLPHFGGHAGRGEADREHVSCRGFHLFDKV
jgi:hypothetical protein